MDKELSLTYKIGKFNRSISMEIMKSTNFEFSNLKCLIDISTHFWVVLILGKI